MSQTKQNYYTNPAFCQKSEYYPNERSTSPRTRALSPERRHPPVGAQKPSQVEHYNSPPKVVPKPRTLPRKPVQKTYDNDEEYEEMLVDDSYASPASPPRKPIQEVDNHQQEDQTNGNRSYAYINGNNNDVVLTKKGRYAVVQVEEEYVDEPKSQKSRYEYIPMQEQVIRTQKVVKKPVINQEQVEINGRVHRYAVIPVEEVPQRYAKSPPKGNQGRYAEIPPQEEDERVVTNKRYAMVPVHTNDVQTSNRYAVVSPERAYQERQKNRYEYIDEIDNSIYQQEDMRRCGTSPPKNIKSPHTPRKGNPEATQKLHELLITPQKFQKAQSSQRILSPQAQRKVEVDPFQTPNKTPPKPVPRNHTPKAQQKLNYALSTKQNLYDKRQNTAVIAPICSSPVQSVYSETTFSNKTESWMNLSLQKAPAQTTLAVAAVMMILCGGLSSGLCFYMVSILGRMYYLDFGIISGFACLLLGCLGFRGRNCHWLPNRNYISGNTYCLLSVLIFECDYLNLVRMSRSFKTAYISSGFRY